MQKQFWLSGEDQTSFMNFTQLRAQPEKFPTVTEARGIHSLGMDSLLYAGSLIHKIYEFLKANPDKAFLSSEIDVLVGKYNHCRITGAYGLWTLAKRGFIYKLPFKIPFIGYCGGYLFSFSEIALWKRFWSLVPDNVRKALALVWKTNCIYSIQELVDLTGVKRSEIKKWFLNIFVKKIGILKVKCMEGLRTFYYNAEASEEKFQQLYELYYKEQILRERSVQNLNAKEFEEFATWTFCEYMKLKGMNLELVRFDSEPIDYVAKAKVDLSDTLGREQRSEVTIAQFMISCKNYRLDKPLGAWYVQAMSGCLRIGKTFKGKEIFSPENTIGIIFCTNASSYAYEMCAETGIRIFDLHKLLRMHEIVKQAIGRTHPYFERIQLRLQTYRENRKTVAREQSAESPQMELTDKVSKTLIYEKMLCKKLDSQKFVTREVN